jgi:hypothetical protein
MLVSSHDPPPPPPPESSGPGRRRSWHLGEFRRLWLLPAGLGVALLSSVFSPIPAYALILVACVLIGRGLGGVVRNTPGLKDYRQ